MSAGTPIQAVRVPPELAELVRARVVRSWSTRRGPRWSVSDFIRIAVREKLAKMARSAAHRRTPGPRARKLLAYTARPA